MRNRVDRTASLITVDVADKSIHPLGDKYAFASFTAWLPDGSGIVFAANAFGTPGTGNGGQLWLQPFPSGPGQAAYQRRRRVSQRQHHRRRARRIASVGFFRRRQALHAALRGRRSEAAVVGAIRRRDRPGATRLTARASTTSSSAAAATTSWSAAPDGFGRTRNPGGRPTRGTAVSADGKTLVVVAERNKRIGIWRVDAADGGNAREVAAVLDPQHVSPSPDGKTFYFTSAMDGRALDIPRRPRWRRAGAGRALPRARARCRPMAPGSPAIYRESPSGGDRCSASCRPPTAPPIKSFPEFFSRHECRLDHVGARWRRHPLYDHRANRTSGGSASPAARRKSHQLPGPGDRAFRGVTRHDRRSSTAAAR